MGINRAFSGKNQPTAIEAVDAVLGLTPLAAIPLDEGLQSRIKARIRNVANGYPEQTRTDYVIGHFDSKTCRMRVSPTPALKMAISNPCNMTTWSQILETILDQIEEIHHWHKGVTLSKKARTDYLEDVMAQLKDNMQSPIDTAHEVFGVVAEMQLNLMQQAITTYQEFQGQQGRIAGHFSRVWKAFSPFS